MAQPPEEKNLFQHTLKGAKILLAQAAPGDFAHMEGVLTNKGYCVKQIHNLQTAIETIEEISPDLIIADIQLPEMAAMEICRHLKANKKFQGIPIIIVGTVERIAEKEIAFQAGCADFIVQPIQQTELLAKVKTHISKRSFLSHISHELRTPLNAILGFSRMMETDSNLTEKQIKNLGLIYQSGRHLVNLINEMLDMPKIDAGLAASEIPCREAFYGNAEIDPATTGQRIAVVDDNETNRLLLSELLQDVGFIIKEAENGEKAVALFSQWHPHMIFMDICMPVMDGMAATKIIKASEKGRSTPVIALTAHAGEEERQKISEAGCDALIRKPFEETELLEIIAKHLNLAFGLKEKKQMDLQPKNKSPKLSIEALAEQLAVLPAALLKELEQNALILDLENINACIEKIQALNSSIGESLKELSKSFQFNKIYHLSQRAVQSKK